MCWARDTLAEVPGSRGPPVWAILFALHWCWYGGTVRSHVGAFGHEQGDPLGEHLELVWASILCSNLSVLSVWGANINNGAYQHLSSWRVLAVNPPLDNARFSQLASFIYSLATL